MSTPLWQKSSYCQEGEACVHISSPAPSPTTIHLTESADPTAAVLSATPIAFSALLDVLKAADRPQTP
ncbi:hypothetical protein SLINC_3705 [Streptomyces lincolnensis]|uniref:Uncharacterized protein n=1 Tax=Streptomyces lincolnensis TaxID=1915 RepID=A0A1B1MBD4_STRLN|nr:DUF397 domain-containing protein [Streptomyces lincolnensis]ANS65929.1 hypothetical protein SLINC_3705 [Streptomyces lincolnensis]AXG54308.1 hypothetical protein SLCG_3153 [Streptomyces lincolnensis]QMV08681.1 DUF397 domain-containing protein [Streptomyces lincolnensis]